MQEKKVLFAYTIKKQIEKSVETPSKDANGKDITIVSKVKTVEPKKFRFLQPTRKLRERAELFNAKMVSQYTLMGLMPITLIAKRFGNDGGPLTENERDLLKTIESTLIELEKEFFSLAASKEEKDLERRTTLAYEIIQQRERQASLQNAYLSLFENTAEMKARKKLGDWWVANLIEHEVEVKDDDGKTTLAFVPLIPGKTDEEKIDNFLDLCEDKDPYLKEAANKASYVVSYWFNSSFAPLEQTDYEMMERVYEKEVSDYKVQDDLAPKTEPVEEKPEPEQPAPVSPPEPVSTPDPAHKPE